MENGKIGVIRNPKPLNQLSQNLALVIVKKVHQQVHGQEMAGVKIY